jgi:hypothetical protein
MIADPQIHLAQAQRLLDFMTQCGMKTPEVWAVIVYDKLTKHAEISHLVNDKLEAECKARAEKNPTLILDMTIQNPGKNWEQIVLWLCDNDVVGADNKTAQRQINESMRTMANKYWPGIIP